MFLHKVGKFAPEDVSLGQFTAVLLTDDGVEHSVVRVG